MLAYSFTNEELSSYLIEKGIEINARDTFGVNVFMQASFICNLPLLKKLTDKNANINLTDNDNWTALDYAESSYVENKNDVVVYLKSLGVQNGINKKEKPAFRN